MLKLDCRQGPRGHCQSVWTGGLSFPQIILMLVLFLFSNIDIVRKTSSEFEVGISLQKTKLIIS